jgi:hypothetical protein
MALNLSGTTGIVTGNIAPLNITTATIADDNVTTAKILNANVTPAKLSQPMTLETAKAYNWNGLTTNTSLEFTGIPSWVKKVTVMLSSVSVSGSSVVLIQIGDSGGIENFSYIASGGAIQPSAASGADFTAGFGLAHDSGSGSTLSGSYTISNLSGNSWVFSGSARQTGSRIAFAAGEKTLSAVLDRVRITTVNGTDTFDAGTVNIMYEG